jgi:hypothetical protein
MRRSRQLRLGFSSEAKGSPASLTYAEQKEAAMSPKYQFSSRRFVTSLLAGAVVGPAVGLIDAFLHYFYRNGGAPTGNDMFFGLAWGIGVKGILMVPFGYLLLVKWRVDFGDEIAALDLFIAINCTLLGAIIGLIRSVSFTSGSSAERRK